MTRRWANLPEWAEAHDPVSAVCRVRVQRGHAARIEARLSTIGLSVAIKKPRNSTGEFGAWSFRAGGGEPQNAIW